MCYREFWLPEDIIQVIQSFLSARNAARTTVLSKSWLSAWLTRPNLDFDITEINTGDVHKSNTEISDLVEKIFKRYEDSNLNVDSFRLRLKYRNDRYAPYYPCPYPWIAKALQLGATRLDLRPTDVVYFPHPNEVFGFESKHLVALALERWKIYDLPEVIACSMLRSLRLDDVKILRDDTIFRVISSCPLLRKLYMCYVCVDDDETDDDEDLVVRDDGPIRVRGHGLRSLTLEYVSFDTSFFEGDDDLSSRFPHLKKLTLVTDSFWEEANINISSPSLERLHVGVGKTRRTRVNLNVPNIRRLSIGCLASPPSVY